MRFKALTLALLTAAGTLHSMAEAPASSAMTDSIASELEEVTVSAQGPRHVFRRGVTGEVTLSGKMLAEQPSFMGGNDPMGLIRTLPAVATTHELQAALNVHGAGTGANTFLSDNARVVNPLHLLGLYSTYNPAFYKSYTMRTDRLPVTADNCTGAMLEAVAMGEPDTLITGSATVGLIESHAAVRVPLRKGATSVAAGFRRTYLDLLFSDILTFDGSKLTYNFTDMNLGLAWRPGSRDLVDVSFFGNSDRMRAIIDKRAGSKDGNMGWRNYAASLRWLHDAIHTDIAVSGFTNHFMLAEGGRTIDLPSALTQVTARSVAPFGDFSVGSDISYRYCSGQRNRAFDRRVITPGLSRRAIEWNVGAAWSHNFTRGLSVDAGVRLSYYHSGNYNTLIPLPRVALRWEAARGCTLHAAYGRYCRFDRLVEETTAGLPADFWINAGKAVHPEDVNSFTAGVSGMIIPIAVTFSVEGYYRLINNVAEYHGSLLDLANPGYNPLSDLYHGRGYSYGLSVSAMRQVGRLRARASYNLGKSRARFDLLGPDYYPTAHDRLHDLNVTLTWEPLDRLVFSASYTHATGQPYTRAIYGYMIGENLICEYERHNASRLKAYNRTDLSAGYTFGGRRLKQRVNISVYNALANNNVLFHFTSYTIDGGIRQKSSVMKSVIPSVAYTIEF